MTNDKRATETGRWASEAVWIRTARPPTYLPWRSGG